MTAHASTAAPADLPAQFRSAMWRLASSVEVVRAVAPLIYQEGTRL
jgi:hypothetical protein